MVTAWIPLNGGAFAVARCSSPAKAQATYGLPASAFADYAEGQIVHVWAEFLDHGVWSWGEVETTLKGAAPGKVTFTPEVFGR